MIPPPVFTTQEEYNAYADAQKDLFSKERLVGGAVGVAEGLGIIDLLAGVPWLAREAAGQATMASLLQQRDRLERHTDRQTADKFARLDLRSKGALGDKESQEKARNIIAGRSGTYDEAIENTLESLGYNKTDKSEVARQVAFWTTVGVDLAILAKVVIQNAPRGIEAIRNAFKKFKNVDEADQAVMKTQMELGLPETPVQMQMDLPVPKETTPFPTTVEELGPIQKDMFETAKPFNIEEPLYRWNRGPNASKQPGTVQAEYDFVSTSTNPRYALGNLTPADVGGISAFKKIPVISAANSKTTLGDGGQLLALQLDPRKIKIGEVFDPLGNPEHLNRFYHWLKKNGLAGKKGSVKQPYANFKSVGGIDFNQPSVPKNFVDEYFPSGSEDTWTALEGPKMQEFLRERQFKAFISTEKGERNLMVFNEYADDVILPQGKNLAEMRKASEALNYKGYKNGGLVQNSVDYALDQWS